MNNKFQKNALLQLMGRNRNTLFLVMCLLVHASFFAVFLFMGAIPLAVINVLSSMFYILFLLFSKDREKSEKSTVLAYFEIIIFSTLCEIFTRNTYGFIFYVVGMVPVIYYLAPSYGNKRFIYQGIGALSGLMIHHAPILVPDSFFKSFYEELLPYADTFTFINLFITLFTLLYTSFFYELELDMIKNELAYSSTHDPLTGLYNRRFLCDEIVKCKEESVTVVLFDIDNFKRINDSFGHDEGDRIIVSVASCLIEEAEGALTFPVRWGGEEFILCYNTGDTDYIHNRVSEVCSKITELAVLPDNSKVTVTAGLVSGKKSEFDDVLKKADEYLYKGKTNGKNCIVWRQNASQFV